MNEMIERVARAIAVAQGVSASDLDKPRPRPYVEGACEEMWRRYIDHARAALAAMRDMSRDMEAVPLAAFTSAEDYWQAVIDTALKE